MRVTCNFGYLLWNKEFERLWAGIYREQKTELAD